MAPSGVEPCETGDRKPTRQAGATGLRTGPKSGPRSCSDFIGAGVRPHEPVVASRLGRLDAEDGTHPAFGYHERWPPVRSVPSRRVAALGDREMSLVEANRLVAFGLVVLIWLVQLVIYPAFGAIAPEHFVGWHARYTRAVTWVVAPLMLAQVALVGRLLFARPSWWSALAAGLIAVAWTATFALAVPAHERLQADGLDRAVIDRLVATNWIRTAAWTLAFLVLLAGPDKNGSKGGGDRLLPVRSVLGLNLGGIGNGPSTTRGETSGDADHAAGQGGAAGPAQDAGGPGGRGQPAPLRNPAVRTSISVVALQTFKARVVTGPVVRNRRHAGQPQRRSWR